MKADEIVSRVEIPKDMVEGMSQADNDIFVNHLLKSAGFNLDKPMAIRYSCTVRGKVYLQTKGQLV